MICCCLVCQFSLLYSQISHYSCCTYVKIKAKEYCESVSTAKNNMEEDNAIQTAAEEEEKTPHFVLIVNSKDCAKREK